MRAYMGPFIDQITESTKQAVRDAVLNARATGSGTEGVYKAIKPLFSPDRALVIAVTETTKMFGLGAMAMYRARGVEYWEWDTCQDDVVDEECEELADNGPYSMEEPFGPAHPGCRCFPSPSTEGSEDKEFDENQPRDEHGRWTSDGGGDAGSRRDYVPYNAALQTTEKPWCVQEMGDVGIDPTVPGEYGDRLFEGQRIVGATEDQEEAIKLALTHIPEQVRKYLGPLEIMMASKREMQQYSTPVLPEGVVGLAVYDEKKVLFDKDYYANVGKGYIGRKADVVRIVAHELGHIAGNTGFVDQRGIEKETSRASRYGETNYREAWAEAFTNAVLNPKTTLGPLTERYLRQVGFDR